MGKAPLWQIDNSKITGELEAVQDSATHVRHSAKSYHAVGEVRSGTGKHPKRFEEQQALRDRRVWFMQRILINMELVDGLIISSLRTMAMDLLTVGHSNHTIQGFISLLQEHSVTAVADVRSYPYSRFLSHFNRAELQEALASEGIRYVFLGRELGARPSSPECYVDGKALYEKIAATDAFYKGTQRVLKGLKKHKIALMCAEKDPLTCHRAILVCQHLRHLNLHINHILKNGDLESHIHLEDRMLAKHGFTEFAEIKEEPIQLSLFAQDSSNLPTREECLEKAYKLQGYEIAYVETRNHDYDPSNQPIYNRIH